MLVRIKCHRIIFVVNDNKISFHIKCSKIKQIKSFIKLMKRYNNNNKDTIMHSIHKNLKIKNNTLRTIKIVNNFSNSNKNINNNKYKVKSNNFNNDIIANLQLKHKNLTMNR